MSTIDLGSHNPRSNVGQHCKWAVGLVVLGLFALQSTASHSQEAIGSATSVTPQAEGSHGGKHTLAAGSNVYHQEDIETGASGIAGLRFHDNSALKVGPKSRVKLDKFIYDPNRSAGSVAIEAAKGSFRFSTGSQTKGSYQLKTPYGTLGIRG